MSSLRQTGGLVPSNVTLTLTMVLPTLVFGALVLVTVQMSYIGERHLKCFSSLHLCRNGLANGKRLQPGFGSGAPGEGEADGSRVPRLTGAIIDTREF